MKNHLLRIRLLAAGVLILAAAVAQAQPADRDLTQPGSLIISDAQGVIWAFDLERNELRMVADLGAGNNFDIQYRRPFELVIANLGGALQQFNLLTHELTTLVQGPAVGHPIGVTVVPGDGYYYTDHFGGLRRVVRFDPQTGSLDVVATLGSGAPIDGIAHDASRRLIVTAHSGDVYRISTSPLGIEVIAHIPGYRLNGIALTPRGTLVIAAHHPAAVFEVDPHTGTYSTLWAGLPLRNPEDVALDHRGLIYVLDSDFEHNYPDFLPGLYSLDPETSELTALYTGAPLGDIVDLLLTPFDGYR
jgi:DNA-binding beta-propeller fold protein YncE